MTVRGPSAGAPSIAFTTACVKNIVPRRLVATHRVEILGREIDRKSPRTTEPMPALLTRQSMRPNRAMTASTAVAWPADVGEIRP